MLRQLLGRELTHRPDVWATLVVVLWIAAICYGFLLGLWHVLESM